MSRRAPLFLLLAVLALQALFVAAYVVREHTVYFWDHAMYHNMARGLAFAFRQSPADGFAILLQSLTQDYNYLFTLPSLPVFWLLGDSRLVFVAVNFVVFFFAYEAAAAFVLQRVFSLGWPRSLLLSAVLCFLVPPLWVPLFEGYPDVGAAACFVFALGLNVRPDLRLRNALLTGLLLGFAILLRRHFAYAALAGLLSWGLLDACVVLLREKTACRVRALGQLVWYFAACGVATAAVVALAAPEFFLKAVSVDYGALYGSYKKPVPFFLEFALSAFGLGLALLACAGFGLAAWRFPAIRIPLANVGFTAAVWFLVWLPGPRQAGNHYLLHILPLFTVTGLAGLFLALPRGLNSQKILVAIPLAVFLAANSLWALWLAPAAVRPNAPGAPRLTSAPRPPVVRKDYDELLRLGSYLAATTSFDDLVFVLGSSFVFNQDIVRAVLSDSLNRPDVLPRFLQGPEIDSNQTAPLDAFAAASVYAVPEPPQYHLGPEAQKVVTAAAKQFPPPESRRTFFLRDDAVFTLEDGVRVSVWRRPSLSPNALHEALSEIRKAAPGPRQDWISLSNLPRQFITTDPANNLTQLDAVFNVFRSSLELRFDVPLPPGDYRLGVDYTLPPECGALRFKTSVLEGGGNVLASSSSLPLEKSGMFYAPFTIPGALKDAAFLHLQVSVAPRGPCVLLLRGLGVEKR